MKLALHLRTIIAAISPSLAAEFDQLLARINSWAGKEHHTDGTHGAITATGLTITGNATVTGVTTLNGNVAVNGPLAVTGAASIGGALAVGGAISERGRSVPLGDWVDTPFNAAHYAGVAPLTWTVGAPAVIRNRSTRVGNVLFWSMYVSWFSGSNVLGGAPGPSIRITLPGGFLAGAQAKLLDYCVVAGAVVPGGYIAAITGADFVISKSSGANFAIAEVPGMIFNAVIEVNP